MNTQIEIGSAIKTNFSITYAKVVISSVIEVILTLSILASVVFSITLLGYISILCAILLLLIDEKTLLPYYFLTSMATDLFIGALGGGLPRIFLILLFFTAVFKIDRKLKFQDSVFHFFICFFIIISYFLSSTKSLLYLMSSLLNVLVVFTMLNLDMSKKDIDRLLEKIFNLYTIFTIFSSMIMILNPYIEIRGGKTSYSLSENVNANTVAQMMVQIIMFFIGYLSIKVNRKVKYNKYILILILIIIAFIEIYMTGSRSAIFAVIMGLILLVAFKKYYSYSFIKATFIMLVFLCGTFLMILNVPALFERLNILRIIESGGSGRVAMILAEIKYIIPQNLWFGVGIGTTSEVAALEPYFPYTPYSATNIVFSMLTQVGILGTVAFLSYFIIIIRRVIKFRYFYGVILIPGLMFVSALFQGIGENVFYERYLWNTIAIICVCFRLSKKDLSLKKEKAH